MSVDSKQYWSRIKLLLKEQNKTQDSLCLYCGIVPQTFKNRMSVCGSSSVFEAQKIAEYLNTTVEYLVTGTVPDLLNENQELKNKINSIKEIVNS